MIYGAEEVPGPVKPTKLDSEFGGAKQPAAAPVGVGCELGRALDGGQHDAGPSATRGCKESLFDFSRHVLVRLCC